MVRPELTRYQLTWLQRIADAYTSEAPLKRLAVPTPTFGVLAHRGLVVLADGELRTVEPTDAGWSYLAELDIAAARANASEHPANGAVNR